jgi:acyl-CoA thioesterase
MDQIRDYFRRDTFAAHCGMELVEAAPGRAVARMRVQDCHQNAFGMVHGGVIFSLADLAFEAACNAHGTVAVALNVSISFLKAPGREVLTADAREVTLGGRIATYTITVRDEAGDTVALFQGMVYRKRDVIDWSQ